jgi:hypothetical protein
VSPATPDRQAQPVPAAHLPALRDLLNVYVAHGAPPGVELRWLSPSDLDAPSDVPAPCPGVRHFFLHVGLAPTDRSGDDWMYVVSVADDAAADAVAVTHADLLAQIAHIESPLGTVEMCGFEMRDRSMPRAEQRENGTEMIQASRAANFACDAIRDAVADPRAWAPISEGAAMAGHCIGTRVLPDGRCVVLVPTVTA